MRNRKIAIFAGLFVLVLSCRAQKEPPPPAPSVTEKQVAQPQSSKPEPAKREVKKKLEKKPEAAREEKTGTSPGPALAKKEKVERSSEKKVEKKSENPVVMLETTLGNIKVELYPDRTPVTVENFMKYVEDGFYNGTIFHRVVRNFVIQGGGFDANLAQLPTREPIINEAQRGLENKRGTIAMARTSARNSATSQFYINLRDNVMLDYKGETPGGWGYTAFGKVIEGMDVVDKIGALETGPAGPFPAEVPKQTVTILKAYVVE